MPYTTIEDTFETKDGTTAQVVKIDGESTGGKIFSDVVIDYLGEELLEHVDGGEVCLNFREINFMASGLLMKLIDTHKKNKAVHNRRPLSLSSVKPSIMEVFEITRLNKVFKFYESAEDYKEERQRPY